jgi:predicted HAD superfamily Cof-like phosphohydrolase
MTKHQRRVEEFMRLAEQEVPKTPTIPSEEVRILRAKLIMEEAFETIEKGLGVSIEVGVGISVETNIDSLTFRLNGEPNLLEIADGCADLSVVTIGTLSACGIKDGPLLREVDRTNLMKFEEGGYKREDGKWIKPSDWIPPNIPRILERQK